MILVYGKEIKFTYNSSFVLYEQVCDNMRLINNDKMLETEHFTTSAVFQAGASPAGMLRHCEDEQIVNWQKNADRYALCQHAIF